MYVVRVVVIFFVLVLRDFWMSTSFLSFFFVLVILCYRVCALLVLFVLSSAVFNLSRPTTSSPSLPSPLLFCSFLSYLPIPSAFSLVFSTSLLSLSSIVFSLSFSFFIHSFSPSPRTPSSTLSPAPFLSPSLLTPAPRLHAYHSSRLPH